MSKLDNNNELMSHEAASWVAQIDNGPLSNKDKLALAEWLNRSPAHGAELRLIAKIWGDVDDLIDDALDDCIQTKDVSEKVFFKQALLHRPYTMLSYASSFVLVFLLSAAYLMPLQTMPYDELNAPILVLSSEKGAANIHQLSDGSSVHLNANSVIEVNYSKEERAVKLIAGEVLFDVEKDKSRPFKVQIKGQYVEAVGTSFVVKRTSQLTEVVVTEGIVKYYEILQGVKKNSDIQLRIGQAGRFSQNKSEVINLSQQQVEDRIAWLNGELVFSGEPLSYVIAEISRYNDIQISITPEISNLKIGGRFDINDVDRILQALQISEGLDIYTSKNGTIYLSKKKAQ